MLKELEKELCRRGFSTEVRKAIHNAKICVIDDQIEHLKSFIEGLRKEGFTNLTEKSHIESVNELLESGYELIILDLKGVAEDISAMDGIGIVETIKQVDPALPIIIVSGTSTTPDKAKSISKADLIRTKPVLPADLSNDVEDILKTRKDPYWSAITVLKELQRIKPEVVRNLGYMDRLKLWWLQRGIVTNIKKSDKKVISKVLKAASIVEKLGSLAIRIHAVAQGIS